MIMRTAAAVIVAAGIQSAAMAADPVVSNVAASQRAGTKLVDISYDLADPDSPQLTVKLWVSSDGGTTWTVHPDHCVGDVGNGIAPGTGKNILWNAGLDFAGFNSSNMKVKVVAVDTVTLTYTAGAHGTISGLSPQTLYYGATGSAVTAMPATGYHFTGWSDSVATASRTDANVTGDISVTANFDINSYTLTYTAGANGSITGTSPQTVEFGGSGSAVTAVPDSGYYFLQWSDGVTTASRTNTNVAGNINVTAIFAIIRTSDYVVVDVSNGPSGPWTVSEQATVPADLLTDDSWRTTKILLRRISAGTFTMGSPVTEPSRSSNETQHSVTLSSPFYIGVFDVTQKQYELVTGATPSSFSGDPKRPVEQVSWNDARGGAWPNGAPSASTFMGKLRAGTDVFFDLPTEAQWEYACRAGTTKSYNDQTQNGGAGTDDTGLLANLGWYSSNSGSATHDVGGKQANAWGLYDMHGNVFEWCLDWWDGSDYSGDVTDPVGLVSGSSRVMRGGYWNYGASSCRSAFRSYSSPASRSYVIGFRLALPAGQ